MITIRDMKSHEPNSIILNLVESYNDMAHLLLNIKSTNKLAKEDKLTYIEKMNGQENSDHFIPGDSVRVVLDKIPLMKHRTNLSNVSYIADSYDGNQFVIRSSGGSVDTVPGYKPVKSAKKVLIATIIKDGKRGIYCGNQII